MTTVPEKHQSGWVKALLSHPAPLRSRHVRPLLLCLPQAFLRNGYWRRWLKDKGEGFGAPGQELVAERVIRPQAGGVRLSEYPL